MAEDERHETILRDGQPADEAACGRIIAAASIASPLPDRLPHALAKWSDPAPLPAQGRTRVMAEQNGTPVGFADYDPARGHVRYLFVTPTAQGTGVGSALLRFIQERLGTAISLHCLAVNDVAVAWYLRHGFAVADGFLEALEGQDTVWLRLVRDYSAD